ncbi:hypothetical protein D3C72_1774170 [compost metagenome]
MAVEKLEHKSFSIFIDADADCELFTAALTFRSSTLLTDRSATYNEAQFIATNDERRLEPKQIINHPNDRLHSKLVVCGKRPLFGDLFFWLKLKQSNHTSFNNSNTVTHQADHPNNSPRVIQSSRETRKNLRTFIHEVLFALK